MFILYLKGHPTWLGCELYGRLLCTAVKANDGPRHGPLRSSWDGEETQIMKGGCTEEGGIEASGRSMKTLYMATMITVTLFKGPECHQRSFKDGFLTLLLPTSLC